MARLSINRGTTFTINGIYQRNGVAASLIGATIRFTIKTLEYTATTDDSDAAVRKNVTNGDANGNYSIALLPADTATLTPGKYYYDIKVQLPTGEIYKLDEGQITFDGSPTNRLS